MKRGWTMHSQIPRVTLTNGWPMPVLGFGVFELPPEQTEQAVGRAIARSGVPRDELFVITELWIQDAGEDSSRRAFERSLDRLGLTIATLVSSGQSTELGFYVDKAMDNGLTAEDVDPLMNRLAHFTGWPKVFTAMPVVTETLQYR